MKVPLLVRHGVPEPRGHGESFSKDFKRLALGTITLGKGPTTLVLRATTIPGGSAADVRRLVLRPAQSP